MPKRSEKSDPKWHSVSVPEDVATWLAERAENTGMPRAAIVREAVEAYKRSLEMPAMERVSTAQIEREGALRARIATLEASLKAPQPIMQVNATTTTAGTIVSNTLSSSVEFQRDPKSLAAFIEMMGFCETCERDVRSYLDQYHLSHQWLIRKAINGLFEWAPHQEGCPSRPAAQKTIQEDAPCPSTPAPTPPTPTS